MNEVKLKPCPFCGSVPTVEFESRGRNCSTIIINIYIRCDKCRISKSEQMRLNDDLSEPEHAVQRAVLGWNTRYTENPSEINANAPNSGENNLGK